MTRAVDLARTSFDRRQMLAPVNPVPEPAREDKLDIRSLITTLRRRSGLFFAVAAGILVLTAALTFTQQKRYLAVAQIVLNLDQQQITPQAGQAGAGQQLPPSDRVETEVQVLKSRELAGRVAQSLNLAADPTFNPNLKPRSTGLVATLKGLVGLGGDERGPTVVDTRREMIDQLTDSLQVTRAGDTYAIDIAVSATNPANAARIANQYVREYTEGQLRGKLNENQVATAFLSSRLEELRAQAHADMQRVQQFRIANNLLSTSGASLTEQEISSYNQAVATARAQAVEDQARLNTARAQLRGGSTGDDVGEALGSTVVSGLRAQQAEVSGRLAVLRARYNDVHPDVIKAQSELADVNSRIEGEISRVISNLEAKSRVSAQRLSSIAGSLASARGALAQNNRAMTDLDDLERRAEASQGLYDSYLNRFKETSAAGGTERPDASLISAAEVPLRPMSPNVRLNLILGLLLGIGAGIAAAFIAEMMFSGLTTGQEVEEKLGLPYLTGIPTLSSLSNKSTSATDSVVEDPRSMFAEAFRSLRTSLLYATHVTPQIIVILSSLPKEGKTTIATCLARMIAQTGESVALLDCDLAQPRLSRRLTDGGSEKGLIELLSGQATLEEVMVRDRVSNVMIIPLAGAAAGTGELLTGDAMIKLLETLRGQFTHIIIDSAPVLPVAESRILAAMADAVIFVARWRHTADHVIKAALRLLPAKHVRIAGVVLSRIDMKKQARFGHGDATSYYKQYKDYYR